ncbi:hypothetical protein LL067_16590, partial [Yersinia pseudotuberculosis]
NFRPYLLGQANAFRLLFLTVVCGCIHVWFLYLPAQLLNCSTAQLLNCSTAQLLNCSTAQLLSVPTPR